MSRCVSSHWRALWTGWSWNVSLQLSEPTWEVFVSWQRDASPLLCLWHFDEIRKSCLILFSESEIWSLLYTGYQTLGLCTGKMEPIGHKTQNYEQKSDAEWLLVERIFRLWIIVSLSSNIFSELHKKKDEYHWSIYEFLQRRISLMWAASEPSIKHEAVVFRRYDNITVTLITMMLVVSSAAECSLRFAFWETFQLVGFNTNRHFGCGTNRCCFLF